MKTQTADGFRPQRLVSWVIKASKLCNLRCRYCYEWNELGRRERVALGDWARLLRAASTYHERLRRHAPAGAVQTRLVWHGGEPLLLPDDYVASVMELQYEILGENRLRRGEFTNSVQTNLVHLSDTRLDFLVEHRFRIGVSFDGVAGERLDRGGHETESKVAANMDRLLARGLDFGGMVVLAGHTAPRILDVYDFYEALGVDVRFIPVFDAPLNTPGASFSIRPPGVVAAFTRLFDRWLERGFPVRVDPLQHYLEIALLHLHGLEQARVNRSLHGENVLLVNTDGLVYQVWDRYDPSRAIGNLFTQSLDEMLSSAAYRRSLRRAADRAQRHCRDCPFLGACNTQPVFAFPERLDRGPCPVANPMVGVIIDRLRREGFVATAVDGLLELRDARMIGASEARASP